MKYLLMIPGPVESPDEIIEAYNGQTVAHYGKEFRNMYLETTEMLSRILGCSGRSFLMPGSGTTALEATAANFCNQRRCLVINNGYFGDRIYEISKRYSSITDQVYFEKGDIIDLKKVEEKLKNNKYDILWSVHVDTSIGVLNPIKEITALGKKYGCLVFVDAIASAGLEEIKMDEWDIDGIAGASQKGFACPAGLGLLTVRERLIENIMEYPQPGVWYPDLRVWLHYYKEWNDWHPYPSTLPSNVVKALNKSLTIIEEEGIGKRVDTLKTVSGKVVEAVRALGLDTFIDEGYIAHGLTAVSTLGKFDASEFVEFLKEKFLIQVGGSLDKKMRPLVIRIGHMTTKQYQIRNLMAVIGAIGVFLKIKGCKVQLDAALNKLM